VAKLQFLLSKAKHPITSLVKMSDTVVIMQRFVKNAFEKKRKEFYDALTNFCASPFTAQRTLLILVDVHKECVDVQRSMMTLLTGIARMRPELDQDGNVKPVERPIPSFQGLWSILLRKYEVDRFSRAYFGSQDKVELGFMVCHLVHRWLWMSEGERDMPMYGFMRQPQLPVEASVEIRNALLTKVGAHCDTLYPPKTPVTCGTGRKSPPLKRYVRAHKAAC